MAATSTTAVAQGPAVTVSRNAGRLELGLKGTWTTQSLSGQDKSLYDLQPDGVTEARIDLHDIITLDTAGAWLVYRTARDLAAKGVTVDVVGAGETYQDLVKTVGDHDVPCPPPPAAANPLVALLDRTGRNTVYLGGEGLRLVNFLGLTITALLRLALRPHSLRLTMLVNHMENAGINALPIVGLISFLIGVVLAFQGADQLARFGAQIFTVNLVGYGVLREMGILLTAIIVAGRSGSAYTAQIGTMKVNEEIDAMRTLGLDPMEVLVLPRILALVLVMPLLTFYADMMGLLGGAVMAYVDLDISFYQFFRQLHSSVPIGSFWVGMMKAPLFGFIIAMVGCYEGLKVSRSAESVGLRTTSSVVKAIFLVIVLDAFASVFFSVIGI